MRRGIKRMEMARCEEHSRSEEEVLELRRVVTGHLTVDPVTDDELVCIEVLES